MVVNSDSEGIGNLGVENSCERSGSIKDSISLIPARDSEENFGDFDSNNDSIHDVETGVVDPDGDEIPFYLSEDLNSDAPDAIEQTPPPIPAAVDVPDGQAIDGPTNLNERHDPIEKSSLPIHRGDSSLPDNFREGTGNNETFVDFHRQVDTNPTNLDPKNSLLPIPDAVEANGGDPTQAAVHVLTDDLISNQLDDAIETLLPNTISDDSPDYIGNLIHSVVSVLPSADANDPIDEIIENENTTTDGETSNGGNYVSDDCVEVTDTNTQKLPLPHCQDTIDSDNVEIVETDTIEPFVHSDIVNEIPNMSSNDHFGNSSSANERNKSSSPVPDAEKLIPTLDITSDESILTGNEENFFAHKVST